jgi:DNA-binding transcriptional LysR family regulator
MPARFEFDLNALDVFIRVAKTGNMSHAAQQLNMTQSSISQILSNLESTLQTKLFDRSLRPIQLTSGGRFLLDRSIPLLNEASTISQLIKSADFTNLRHINVALVDSIATAVGHSLINALKKRSQELSIKTGLSHMHCHELLSRKVDIIISDDMLDDHNDLSRFRILREPFILVLPNEFDAPVKNLNQLAKNHSFIRYSDSTLIGRTIERHLRSERLDLPERLQLDNSYAIVSSVSEGMGWTITTPLCLFQSGIKRNHVQIRRLPTEALYRYINLIARKDELGDLPEQIAQDCISILKDDFLTEVTKEQPWLLSHLTLG